MKPKLVVVGGTIAGMMAVLKAAEEGSFVQIISEIPLRRSSDTCHRDGIAGVMNPKRFGDSVDQHVYDTMLGGDFLVHQRFVRRMCEDAPSLIALCDRIGVPFNRNVEGKLHQMKTGGSSRPRTVYADAVTGQQIVYALDGQLRRLEERGIVERFEYLAFCSIVREEDGGCCGVIAMDTRTHEFMTFPADAVILSAGGYAGLYGKSTASIHSTGAEIAQVYLQGAELANPEFIQFHPATLMGADKRRPITELVSAFGGRLSVRKDNRTWHFMAELHQQWDGNVPYDVATRSVCDVGEEEVDFGFECDPSDEISRLIDLCEKFCGEEVLRNPMKVAPAVHYTMGGLWVDDNHMTTIPGLFVAGESDYAYHGASCLGSNIMLSALHGGMVAGSSAAIFASKGRRADEVVASVFDREKDRQEGEFKSFMEREEGESPRVIEKELKATMDEHVGIKRDEDGLKLAADKVSKLKERFKKCCPTDKAQWANTELKLMKVLSRQLELAEVIIRASMAREESRGAHFRIDHPTRDDGKWGVITKATHTAEGPLLNYERIDIGETKPIQRKYD